MILGLDLGRYMGYAILDSEGNRVKSGTVDLVGTKKGSDEEIVLRFKRLQDFLSEQLMEHPLERIAFEDARYAQVSSDARENFFGYLATLRLWCYYHAIPLHGYHVGTIKILATGKGKASKLEMVEAAREKWGLDLWLHSDRSKSAENHADGLWTAQLGYQRWSRE